MKKRQGKDKGSTMIRIIRLLHPERYAYALLIGVFALAMPQLAAAAGTASGTDITNTATLSYSVNAISQDDVDSNTTTFKVDNKVIFTMTESAATYILTTPGQTAAVMTFNVASTGNTVQDFALAATDTTDRFPDANDNFNAANVNVYAESGDTPGSYQAGEDTDTYIDELGVDSNVDVYVVADIVSTRINDDIASYLLTATAATGGSASSQGADLVETAGADTAGSVDIVFADGAGRTDAAGDGTINESGSYKVVSSELTVTKTTSVIRDPFNDDTNPKRIPGSWVQYSIAIANDAGAGSSATLTTITDTLAATTALDEDLIVGATGNPENAADDAFKVSWDGGARTSFGGATGDQFFTHDTADGVIISGADITATMATVMPTEDAYAVGELKAGDTVTLIFNVIVQ